MKRLQPIRAALAILALAAGLAGSARAGSVTIAWDAPTNCVDGAPVTVPLGYRLYLGPQSRVYVNSLDVGTNLFARATNVADNAATYFAATSYCLADGLESEFSDELVWDPVHPATNLVPWIRQRLVSLEISVIFPDRARVPDLVPYCDWGDPYYPSNQLVVTQDPAAGAAIDAPATVSVAVVNPLGLRAEVQFAIELRVLVRPAPPPRFRLKELSR